MKFIRISFIAMLLGSFLVSVSGILMYYAECACTGEISATLYAAPDQCSSCDDGSNVCNATDIYDEALPADSCCAEGSGEGCSNDENCACGNPEPQLYRIDDQFSLADAAPANFQIWKLMSFVELEFSDVLAEIEISTFSHKPPPPRIAGYHDFIHFICQPKIPSIA